MEVLFNLLKDNFSTLSIVIFILLVLISLYNEIKYLCLKKACEEIVKAESYTELSGEEKFQLVTEWITKSMPRVFAISVFQTIIKKLIQFAYDNSFAYMSNYIRRKTGYDITDLIEEIKSSQKSE